MLFAYDLDGVLAQAPPKEWFTKPWRHMSGAERMERQAALTSWYRLAPVLLGPDPTEALHVITARKRDQREVTLEWFVEKLPEHRLSTLDMLIESRTLSNVIEHKRMALLGLLSVGVTDFVEDNAAVLRGLAKLGVYQRLHLFSGVGDEMSLFWDPHGAPDKGPAFAAQPRRAQAKSRV